MLARNWRTTGLLELGDFAGVERELARVEHMAIELRQPRAMIYVPLHRAMTAVARGRLDEAEALNAESRKIGARLAKAGSELAAAAQLVVIRMLQGRLPEIEPALRALADTHPTMITLRCAIVVMLLQSGEVARARADFDAILAAGPAALPRDNTHIVALALLADAARALGDETRARALHGALERYAGRWVVSPTAAALWPVDRSLGVLAATFGDTDLALSHLAVARALGEAADARPTLGLVALDEARVLALRGDPGAGDHARRARVLAEELGMREVADAARALEAA
ncbi:MAG: hypothetical protein ACR2KV_05070 [Solirubrobacteraceae bacterium]